MTGKSSTGTGRRKGPEIPVRCPHNNAVNPKVQGEDQMAKLPDRREEKIGGQVVHKVPFPTDLTPETLADLQDMAPILIEQPYAIRYLHSYGQDSPFFAGLTNRVLLGARDPETGYTYATPRGHDMYSGRQTQWTQLPDRGKVHSFTVCHFGGEEFLPKLRSYSSWWNSMESTPCFWDGLWGLTQTRQASTGSA